jgi:hypothetical protein
MGLLARRMGLLARVLVPVAGASLTPFAPRTNKPPLGPRNIMRPLASFFPVGITLGIILGAIVFVYSYQIFFSVFLESPRPINFYSNDY